MWKNAVGTEGKYMCVYINIYIIMYYMYIIIYVYYVLISCYRPKIVGLPASNVSV